MPGFTDIMIETEDAQSKYQYKLYLKCDKWSYTGNHSIKIYDLGLVSFLADALGWEMVLPPFASDFGKYIESFDFEFILEGTSESAIEEKMKDMIVFTRFISAFAGQCFLYIGSQIKDDGTRLLGVSGKGIECKPSNLDFYDFETDKQYVKGRLRVICCIDLVNW